MHVCIVCIHVLYACIIKYACMPSICIYACMHSTLYACMCTMLYAGVVYYMYAHKYACMQIIYNIHMGMCILSEHFSY